MSYILEALKKSDQQRQRGATPTLQAVQVKVVTPKRPLYIYYSLVATVLIGAGIMIGWVHPWQPEQAPFEKGSIAAESGTSIPQQAAPAPLAIQSEMAGNTTQEFPVPISKPTGQPVVLATARKLNNPALVNSGASNAVKSTLDKSTGHSDAAEGQEVVTMNELPLQIQQEIPVITVQLHAYSNIPSERLVSINSIRLREGESLMLGLKLEEITQSGMIFSYRGYRFQHGIR